MVLQSDCLQQIGNRKPPGRQSLPTLARMDKAVARLLVQFDFLALRSQWRLLAAASGSPQFLVPKQAPNCLSRRLCILRPPKTFRGASDASCFCAFICDEMGRFCVMQIMHDYAGQPILPRRELSGELALTFFVFFNPPIGHPFDLSHCCYSQSRLTQCEFCVSPC